MNAYTTLREEVQEESLDNIQYGFMWGRLDTEEEVPELSMF